MFIETFLTKNCFWSPPPYILPILWPIVPYLIQLPVFVTARDPGADQEVERNPLFKSSFKARWPEMQRKQAKNNQWTVQRQQRMDTDKQIQKASLTRKQE